MGWIEAQHGKAGSNATERYNVLDLFSGIGGMSLGLERTSGFRTVAFCEINPYARRVLAKHWPEVRQYDDVTTLTGRALAADGIAPDVVVGGFPCQDLSQAGAGAGLAGARSGLWFEMLRIIEEVRPQWVIIENVPALRSRGLDVVLGGLAAIGFDAEWHLISAASLGAHHLRERVWIIAYARSVGLALWQRILPRWEAPDAAASAFGGRDDLLPVGREVHGVPNRVDRLRCLGNALVPQIPELIGRAILDAAA